MRINMGDVKDFILKKKKTTYKLNSFLCGRTSVWSGNTELTITEVFTSASPVAFTYSDTNYSKATGKHPTLTDALFEHMKKNSAYDQLNLDNDSFARIPFSVFDWVNGDGYISAIEASMVFILIVTDADKASAALGVEIAENGIYCPCIDTTTVVFVYGDVITPTDSKYFTFTLLDNGTYEIAKNVSSPELFTPAFVKLPSTYNGKAVTRIANDGFNKFPMAHIIIPTSIVEIGNYGLKGGLFEAQKVSFDKGSRLTTIGDYGLEYCYINCADIENLTKLTTIGRFGLNSTRPDTGGLVLPDSLISIGDYGLGSGSLYTEIFVPASVTTVGERAFELLTNATIYCEAESKPDGWADNWNHSNRPVVWGYKPTDDSYFTFTEQDDGTYSVVAKDSTNMPNEVYVPFSYNGKAVTALGYKAFNNCYNITKIVLPESIKTIGSTAFQNCEALTEVNIPSGVTEIGDYTFFNCKALTTVTIPSGVTSIGELAFANCSAMTSIVIPASVTTIGMQAFFNSRNLTINCEATEQPEGWVNGWNSSGLTVNWGYTG